MEYEKIVSLPWIHKHSMVPWNDMGKGDCCGHFETTTDGYYCGQCKFFVHKKCSESSEYIEHPSHFGHTLQFRSDSYHNCDLCGKGIKNLFYRCEECDFDIDLYCSKYPPPEVIDVSEKHHHKLTLLKEEIDFDCDECGKSGEDEFAYECRECDLYFHVDCVFLPLEVKHPLEYTTMEAGCRVSLPWIHMHFMTPWNVQRKGDCCGRIDSITDGYYCQRCDFFVHNKCGEEVPVSIQHPSHSVHQLWLQKKSCQNCDLCGKIIVGVLYRCEICDFTVDLHCGSYPPPEFIESAKHCHKLTLLKERMDFDCLAKCGKPGEIEYAYKCYECDESFHVDCVWHPHPAEVNNSYHPWHPLKLIMGRIPDYSDGKCRLCGKLIDDKLFYHCSSCNFTLDMCCVLHPPPQSLLDLKAHDHQLTLLPRLRSFTCNACGLSGDRSPYVCVLCDFMIHQDCLTLPRIVNINRHDHRIFRTSVLGVVNSVCGVCRKKVDWTCGGYLSQRCSSYVVHSKCATRKDVWNGKELEGVPEEIKDIEPYVVIDENTIQHFSHKEHYLRRNGNGLQWEENKRCRACNHPIGLKSFYGCIDCDFVLHQKCAECPKRKWHVLHNEQLALVICKGDTNFACAACGKCYNGFSYHHKAKNIDVQCGSISEPFVHPSHPQHPLYHIPQDKYEICNGCEKEKWHVLTCIEDGCEFVICFQCATLPQEVKHRIDDHPLSLCYGDEGASGKYWCEICEKETNPKTWFYTCKDHQASLHTKCVLGEFAGVMLRSTINLAGDVYEVVLNDSISRPICKTCESHCIYPTTLKFLKASDRYICSYDCASPITQRRFRASKEKIISQPRYPF